VGPPATKCRVSWLQTIYGRLREEVNFLLLPGNKLQFIFGFILVLWISCCFVCNKLSNGHLMLWKSCCFVCNKLSNGHLTLWISCCFVCNKLSNGHLMLWISCFFVCNKLSNGHLMVRPTQPCVMYVHILYVPYPVCFTSSRSHSRYVPFPVCSISTH
jgi:hypothetical protein